MTPAPLPICCRDTIRDRGPRDPTDGAELCCRHCLTRLRYTEQRWCDIDYDEWIAREHARREVAS